MSTRLPAPRVEGQYAVAQVCLGNICRSPMADVVLRSRLEAAGLADRVRVASAGTGDWHVGDAMDRRAAATLSAHGYDPSRHRAQQFRPEWLDAYDLVLAMDRANLAALGGRSERVRLFRDLDPEVAGRAVDADDGSTTDADVPDPYYGGDEGFEEVLAMVERTTDTLVAAVAEVAAVGS